MPLATPRTEATYAQMWRISERITQVLNQLGSSGDEVLIANYIAKTMRIDFFDTFPVNKRFFPNVPPAGTGFGYPAVSSIPEINVQVEVIATVRGRKKGFTFGPDLTKPTTHYTMATGAGKYIFLSGRAGINWQKNGDPVVASSDLTAWNGQHIMVGRIEKEQQVFLQAWYCYAAIEKIVKEVGGTLEDVVKTNVFVMDVAHLPLVERARDYFFKEHRPVETVIPITQCTMHKELLVEVEPIIVLRGA
jgi:enamine deaminase RidA (YjgF/YER057c/UK114 family)